MKDSWISEAEEEEQTEKDRYTEKKTDRDRQKEGRSFLIV